jgi:outer membrane protein TolC
MQRLIKMAMAMSMLSVPLGLHAQISLSSAVDLALQSDPKVRMADASVRKAQAALEQTRDVYVPSVNANGGYGYGFGVPTGLPTIFSLSSQSLVFNFSQRDNIRAAASALEAAKLSLRETRDHVTEDVVVTYLNLNSDEKRLGVMTEEYQSATRLVAISQDRLTAGLDSQTNLLETRKTAAQIRLNQILLQDEADRLRDHLARLIGLPGNQLTTVPSSIPALPDAKTIVAGGSTGDSFGIQSALAAARSKQELAFGESRYRLRPQASLGINYSRIDTSQNEYTTYYPAFKGRSESAVSLYLQIDIPIYDKKHQDSANESAAEASRARYEAEDQRNTFLEGRFKLQHSASELEARSDLAEIDRDLAQENLKATIAQLTASSADTNRPQLTPKDEQSARVDADAKTIDLLDAQFQLDQVKVNMLRQSGELEDWIKAASRTPEPIPSAVDKH